MELTVEKIDTMSYPDFVGLIDQQNTPPGSRATLEYWIATTHVDQNSRLFDLACSTGYSSRYAARVAGAQAFGVDLSASAVASARSQAVRDGIEHLVEYAVGDACRVDKPDSSFTHVAGGCNFAFIGDRHAALSETHRLLRPAGMLCTANFFYRKTPPEEMLDSVSRAIGFRPDSGWVYSYWNGFFSRCFELAEEKIYFPQPENATELKERIFSYFLTGNHRFNSANEEIKLALAERLFRTREILSTHRLYQGIAIQAWRKK